MKANFEQSLKLVLAHEGGFANHPKDPGGPTNFGITQKVFDDFRRLQRWELTSVKNITSTEIACIYREQYWKLIRGDDLPTGLDYAVFDFAVNSGVARAIRYLQRLVKVNDDAVFGNATLGAVIERAKDNEEDLICRYIANRLTFLQSLSTFPTFGKGWTRRVIGYFDGIQETDTGVIDYAIKMARNDAIYKMPEPQQGKAYASNRDYLPEADLRKLQANNDKLTTEIAKSLAIAGA